MSVVLIPPTPVLQSQEKSQPFFSSGSTISPSTTAVEIDSRIVPTTPVSTISQPLPSILVTSTSNLNHTIKNVSPPSNVSETKRGLINEEEWKQQLYFILRGNDEGNIEEEKQYYEIIAKKFYEERIRLRDIGYLTEQNLRELGLRMCDRIVFQNSCKRT